MDKFKVAWHDKELRRRAAMAAGKWFGWQVVKILLRLALEFRLHT
ncbi:hypothetical protein ACFXAO_03470 [Streptomyces lavendulae]